MNIDVKDDVELVVSAMVQENSQQEMREITWKQALQDEALHEI